MELAGRRTFPLRTDFWHLNTRDVTVVPTCAVALFQTVYILITELCCIHVYALDEKRIVFVVACPIANITFMYYLLLGSSFSLSCILRCTNVAGSM
jgi:hypothetical protein